MERHGLPVVDMGQGMLFSKSADRIVECLVADVREAGGQLHLGCRVDKARKRGERFMVSLMELSGETALRFESASLVLALGGLAWPQIGATNLGHRLAKSFGLDCTPLRPGLVPLLAPPEAARVLRCTFGYFPACPDCRCVSPPRASCCSRTRAFPARPY